MNVKRLLFMIAGFLLLGVAFIGIFVPGVPRTGSIIGASFFFSRSSKRLEAWLERTYFFGPFLRHYRYGEGIPTSLKVFSISLMWVGMIISMWIVNETWMYVFLTSLGLIITAHILTIRAKVLSLTLKERG
ncbi:MAG: YbaN family protein [Defluviitaleaceae bacterium]|nr:YbaN family protein [Defluviitaleaceae bacterium]